MLKFFSCHSDSTAKPDIDKDYDTVNFDIHTPTYIGKYLGCEELYRPGLQDICNTVKNIYHQTKPRLKALDHYSVTLSKDELTLRDRDSTEDEERVFGLRRILYCGVYRPQQKIFFFNYQFGPKGDTVNCHVILLPNKEEARSLAKVIQKAFHLQTHELHVQDVENRRLHASGLSESSLSHLHVDESKSGKIRYYNLKPSSSQSLSSCTEHGETLNLTERKIDSELPKDSVDSTDERDQLGTDHVSRHPSSESAKTRLRTNLNKENKSNCLCNNEKYNSKGFNRSIEWETSESSQGNETTDFDGEKNREQTSTSDSNFGSSLYASTEDFSMTSTFGGCGYYSSQCCDWEKLLEMKETDI